MLALFALLLFVAYADAQQCCGDCNADGRVAINELVIAVGNALGSCQGNECCGDCIGAGGVDISELVTCVGNALGGCSGTRPTPTPTPGIDCPVVFTDNNSGRDALICAVRGSPRPDSRMVDAIWFTDGEVVVCAFSDGFFGARVIDSMNANLIGWTGSATGPVSLSHPRGHGVMYIDGTGHFGIAQSLDAFRADGIVLNGFGSNVRFVTQNPSPVTAETVLRTFHLALESLP